jgi:hypothetical protein
LEMSKAKFAKLIIATLLGSLTMFIWEGFSHVVLFIGIGLTPLPGETELREVVKTNITGNGLYSFSGADLGSPSKRHEAVFEDSLRTSTVGILGYRPAGGNPFSPRKLITQFLGNVLSVLIAVQVASLIRSGYWKRVLAVTHMGLLAFAVVSSIYWSWYEFPLSFFVAQILDLVIGFFLAGLVISSVLPQADARKARRKHC